VTSPTQLALNLRGAADAVNVSVDTLRREIHAGNLRAKRVGQEFRISVKALEDWFESLPDSD
jgi:excisionase family DNA binding protein